ncbi:metal ABC transporter solute-binding protein, Zn/Mn family [Kushneria phosphatilytica]|uniref:High-affinity zinc uptake system protein ZnuA n=1 Tax=Kushneria phosphatilytica TaxID=657387 RepID=A0A1S1NTK8_9GAMM|nr:zinc ABC transporter substrate-binding protein [Kushneria phosphatilytica]OHV08810.1 hypothetical protein BH688_12400 [Kushneria phosphatilytica]QEL12529.1 ABC transporter substrate-binding protein [Kushneria phosphatilytica]
MKAWRYLVAGAVGLMPALAMAAPLNVAVSILPEKWLVEQIGGSDVNVTVLVKPGMEPHDYSPSPRQMAELTSEQLYFAIGVPFEKVWLPRLEEHAPDMQVVELQQGLALRQIEAHVEHDEGEHQHDSEAHDHDHDHDQGHHHEHGGADPHVWLDPHNMVMMAHHVADILAARLPAQSDAIHQREQALVQQLQTLDAHIAQQLKPWAGETFMVYHPAFGYFADRYQLHQLPIELSGSEPGVRSLGQLIDRAKAHDIHTIFVQQQFSQQAADRLAQALNARVIALDPLAEDYPANLKAMADALASGFEKGKH